MPVIVAGRLSIKTGAREEFLEKSRESIRLARENECCRDFAVSPDTIEPDRVNIFEKWDTRASLDSFRSDRSGSDVFRLIKSFDVVEYEVDH